jgi:hypothetical protein
MLMILIFIASISLILSYSFVFLSLTLFSIVVLPADPTGLASTSILLTKVTKEVQQIGDSTGERYQFPTSFGFIFLFF